ncbi:MAG: histidinol dehydrogenase [Planctomycetota bacterium]|jgi:histidinol dehydrogenase|nr:histidinol dehydrogenase [Planctomycetota bacterium]
MLEVRTYSPDDKCFRTLRELGHFPGGQAETEATAIIRSVREGTGPAARLSEAAIPPECLRAARDRASDAFITAVTLARVNLRRFHECQRRQGYVHDDGDGLFLSRMVRPLTRAGLCHPDSPAELLMCAVPAQVAGVGEIVLILDPGNDAETDSALLAAARQLDIAEVYRLDGPAAAAVLALGSGPVRKADRIAGRLDAAGMAVARRLYGEAAFSVSFGGGGVAVVADGGANARFIASDLLAQAGRRQCPGPLALLASDRPLAEAVRIEISRRLDAGSCPARVEANLKNGGGLFVTGSLPEAVDAANLLAPARLQLMTRNNRECLAEVENAGSVHLGSWSPNSPGDAFSALALGFPETGGARFLSGLGVEDFIREMPVVEYAPDRLAREARHMRALATDDSFSLLPIGERLEFLGSGW